jgi:hypothetical protein
MQAHGSGFAPALSLSTEWFNWSPVRLFSVEQEDPGEGDGDVAVDYGSTLVKC